MVPSELIVDASILFSFFNSSSARREIFKRLLDIKCNLYSPEYVLEELFNNKSKIMHFAKITESEFDEIFKELYSDLDTFEEKSYSLFLKEANMLSPHGKDSTKDDPYFALSLSINKCSIWSDEEGFKLQSVIKIFSTEDLLKLLGIK